MTLNDVDLNRAVSHALRQEPWLYELELDDEKLAGLSIFYRPHGGTRAEHGRGLQPLDRLA